AAIVGDLPQVGGRAAAREQQVGVEVVQPRVVEDHDARTGLEQGELPGVDAVVAELVQRQAGRPAQLGGAANRPGGGRLGRVVGHDRGQVDLIGQVREQVGRVVGDPGGRRGQGADV